MPPPLPPLPTSADERLASARPHGEGGAYSNDIGRGRNRGAHVAPPEQHRVAQIECPGHSVRVSRLEHSMWVTRCLPILTEILP